MRTITFEDHGQDFLEWDIDDRGIVVACRPFQSCIWNGTRVTNHKTLKAESIVFVVVPNLGRGVTTMNYPVEAIKVHA